MSPFQALYGHEPRHWGIEAASTCKILALKDWLEERKTMQQVLRQHLHRARHIMKFQADKKRTDRSFTLQSDTMVSASTVVPSVKILALTMNFGVFGEVKMLASFLKCFSNVETLHIESALHCPSVTSNEPSGEHHARFRQEISPVYCLRSHVKKMVIHDFRGDQDVFEFLKFVAMNAQELQSLLVVSHEGILSSADKVSEIKDELQCLQFPTGISAVLQVSPKAGTGLRLEKASNITIDDTFHC